MPLCRLLENQGARTLRLPAVEIKALRNRRALAAQLGALESFDIIIFTSANAVRFGASLLDQKRDLALAAIGPATARALNQAGYRVAVQPAGRVDSEGLLLHPRFEHLIGHRILMIHGGNGRQLLQEELARRGATVVCAEVYERSPAIPKPEMLAAVQENFAAGEIQVVTATSLEVGRNLLAFATPEMRKALEQVHWLIPGERIAAGLRELGVEAPLLLADSAEDQDLVSALIRWRASASAA
jgi:uroporphyrinogen-III synthase